MRKVTEKLEVEDAQSSLKRPSAAPEIRIPKKMKPKLMMSSSKKND